MQLPPHRGEPGVGGQVPQIVRMAALELNVVVDLVDHHFQLAGVDSIGAHLVVIHSALSATCSELGGKASSCLCL